MAASSFQIVNVFYLVGQGRAQIVPQGMDG
jgi:hypothetical protein